MSHCCEPDALGAKLAALSRPEFYQARCDRVDVIETHLSWLFLVDDLVYKLKKPCRLSFLDLSTLEARRFNCERELILNRRLAPDTYLSAVPLRQGLHGEFSLSGSTEIVDWLVKMRRLPADLLLDHLIREQRVSEEALERLAALLCNFYRKSDRSELRPEAYVQTLLSRISEHEHDLLAPELSLPEAKIKNIALELKTYLKLDRILVESRINQGHVVDGHGDLRPEHICLNERITIFDCLEFSPALRQVDIADELAFLSLESSLLGGKVAAEGIMSYFTDLSGLSIPSTVFHFYVASRAFLRAKLAAWHLRDCSPQAINKWRAKALLYLDTAAVHLGLI